MKRIPVMDPPVRGQAVLPAVTHKFDLLRAMQLDTEEYRKKIKAEYDAATDAANLAATNMRNYLKEQGVT